MPKFFQYFQKEDFDIDGDGTKRLVNLSQYSKVFSNIADDISFYTYYTVDNSDRLDNISQKIYGTPEYYWTFFLINKELNNSWKGFRKDVNEFNDTMARKYPGTALFFTTGVGTKPVSLDSTLFVPGTELGNGFLGKTLVKNGSMEYVVVENPNDYSSAYLSGTLFSGSDAGSGNYTIASTSPYADAPHHKENSDGEWVIDGTATVSNKQYESDLNDLQFQIKVIRPQHILSVARQFEREMKRRRV
jgi:hypothetical protein